MPGTSSNDPTIVAEIFNELTSSGFLEQLRLECVADVKTKPSYLSLKQRFADLLNKKLSDRDWKMDKTIPRLNIFREQVVECGVLALTIERVVDQVVSWKLRDRFVSIIREILCACWDPKYVEQLKLEKFAMENCSFEQLKQVIKKVCDNIHIDWKPVFNNGEIGNCLASFSFSTSVSHHSDEELYLSDESDNSSSISDHEQPTPTVKQETSTPKECTLKRKELEDNNVEVSRSKRERKTNTKYSSDIYQTSFPKPSIESPVKTSTPVKKAASPVQKQRSVPITPNHHVKKKLNMDNDKSVNKKTEEIITPSKSKVMKTAMRNQELFESKVNEMCHSEEIVYAKKTQVDNLVRKSERRVKRNTLIFWEPGTSQPKTEPFSEEVEITKFQKQSENVKAIASDLEAIAPSTLKTPKTEIKETDAENGKSPKNKSPLAGSASNKRSSDSDLYKPRPGLDSMPKRGRGRPRKIDI